MRRPESTELRREIAGALLFIVLLCILVYSNVLYSPFVYDDRGTVLENETIRSVSSSLAQIQSRRYLGYLSFALNYAAGGLRPYGYHLINNMVHAATAACVFWGLYAVMSTPAAIKSVGSRLFVSLAAGALFAVHPVQTQAVTYISQRFTSLATLFYVSSFAAYVTARVRECGNASNALSRGSFWVWYGFALCMALLGMKTKEIAFTLPVIITFAELFLFAGVGEQRQQLLRLAPFWLMLFAIVALEMYRWGAGYGDVSATVETFSRETAHIGRTEYLFTQLRVIVTYIRLLFFPFNQVFDYDYPVFPALGIFPVAASGLLIVTVLICAYWTRRTPLVSLGIVWFFIAASVESSIIPIRDVMNEHRLYLPSVGICMAVAAALDRAVLPQRWKIVVLGVLVMLFALVAYARNITWGAPIFLWEDAVAKAPMNPRAHNNLGVAYRENQDFKRAIEQFNKALEYSPGYPAAYYNLGDVQFELGNLENAIDLLNKAQDNNIDSTLALDIQNKFARVYSAKGNYAEAIKILNNALEQHPRSLVLLNNLAVQYIKQGDADRAITVLRKALLIREEKYLYRNLAVAYARRNEPQMSREMLEKAASLRNP